VKKILTKALSALLILSFSLTNTLFAYDNLGAGLVSDDLRPDSGDDVRKAMRASAELAGVIHDTRISQRDISDAAVRCADSIYAATEPVLFGTLEIGMVCDREEAKAILFRQGRKEERKRLMMTTDQIARRCLEKSGIKSGEVRERDFERQEGEPVLPRVIKYHGNRTVFLDLPAGFRSDLRKIRKNDIVFLSNKGRLVSLSHALTYRPIRHELKWMNAQSGTFKSGGHVGEVPEGLVVTESEQEAYDIEGNYELYNAACMLWYIFSYCQKPNMWFSNREFYTLLDELQAGTCKDKNLLLAYQTYFPKINANNEAAFSAARRIALRINYLYFIKEAKRYIRRVGTAYEIDYGGLAEMLRRKSRFNKGVTSAFFDGATKDDIAWEYRATGVAEAAEVSQEDLLKFILERPELPEDGTFSLSWLMTVAGEDERFEALGREGLLALLCEGENNLSYQGFVRVLKTKDTMSFQIIRAGRERGDTLLRKSDAERVSDLRTRHERIFGSACEIVVLAPGRGNLIGEHADYPEFPEKGKGKIDCPNYSLPFALPYNMLVSGRRTDDDVIDLYSADFGQRFTFSLKELPRFAENQDFIQDLRRDFHWATYFLGLCYAAQRKGFKIKGGEFVIEGNIPIGSGLSSSAAYSVAAASLMREFYGWNVEGVKLAKVARMAEHVDFNPFVGSRCGLLDQTASIMAQKGKAMLINYYGMTVEQINMKLGEYTFVLVDSRVPRILAETEYNTRVEELKQAPDIFRKILYEDYDIVPLDNRTHVSQFTLAELTSVKDKFSRKHPNIFKRVRHVLTERERTLAFASALRAGDMKRCGKLLNQSGDSLSMDGDYEISGRVEMPDGTYLNVLDILVEEGRRFGAYGGRMMGGGGGGCTIFLLKRSEVAAWQKKLLRAYRARTGFTASFYDGIPSEGSCVVWRSRLLKDKPQKATKKSFVKFGSMENIRCFAEWVRAENYAACEAYLRKWLRVSIYFDERETIQTTFRERYVPYLLAHAPPMNVELLGNILSRRKGLKKLGLAICPAQYKASEASLRKALPGERAQALEALTQAVTNSEIPVAKASLERPLTFSEESQSTSELIAYWALRGGVTTVNGESVIQLDVPNRSTTEPSLVSAQIAPGIAGSVISLKATVPGYGEVDLIKKPEGEKLAELNPVSYGSAVLCPWANRQTGEITPDGKVQVKVNGQRVHLEPNFPRQVAIHGLVYDKALDNLEVGIADGSAALAGTVSLEGEWPSDLLTEVVVNVGGDTMTQTITAINTGDSTTEVGIGTHPYLSLPGPRSRWLLRIPARARVEFNNYNEMLPTGDILGVEETDYDFRRFRPIGEMFLDDCFTEIEADDAGDTVVELVDSVTGIGVRLTSPSEAINAIQVYTPKGENSIAIEFQYNLPDPLNESAWGPGEALGDYYTGMYCLDPGEETTYTLDTQIIHYSPKDLMEMGITEPAVELESRASRGLTGVVPTDVLPSMSTRRLEGLSEEALSDIERNERQYHSVLTTGISVIDLLVDDENPIPGTEKFTDSLALCGKIEESIDPEGALIDGYLDGRGEAVRQVAYADVIGGGPAYSTSRVLMQLSRRVNRPQSAFDVRFISYAGRDEHSEKIRDDLRHLGVDARIAESDKNTARTLGLEHTEGRRTFYHDVGASADLTIGSFTEDDFRGREVFESGGIELGTSLFEDAPIALRMAKTYGGTEETRKRGIKGAITVWDTVVDNPGLWRRYHKQVDGHYRIFQLIDVFAPSIGEACAIYGDAMSSEDVTEKQRKEQAAKIAKNATPEEMANFFIRQGAGAVFLKMGKEGCYVQTTKHSIFKRRVACRIPILPAFREVSGTGTGDAFVAGLIYAVAFGWSPEKTAKFASVIGGMCVENRGGTIGKSDFVDAMRYMDLYRKLEEYHYVGVSMGGSKVLVEIKDGLRRTLAAQEIDFTQPVNDGGFGERGKDLRNKVSADELADLIAREAKALLEKHGYSLQAMKQFYNCSAGPLDEIRGLLGYPEPTTNLPFDSYLLSQEVAERLYGEEVDRVLIPTVFVMQHDGKGGAIGETKENPEANVTTVIHGSGENFTVVRNGIYYTAGSAITECGHASIGTPFSEDQDLPLQRHHFRFMGRVTGQNHPLQVVDVMPDEVVGTNREGQFILKDAAIAQVEAGTSARNFIWQVPIEDPFQAQGQRGPEFDVEDLSSGIALRDTMLPKKEALAETFGGEPENYSELNTAKDLSVHAAQGNKYAKVIIAHVAGEMGRALAAYIYEFRGEKFVENIIMVSALGERLGLGTDLDGRGRDIYLASLQDACEAELFHLGVPQDEARKYARGISRSPGTADREILAAAPQVRQYTKPAEDELGKIAASLVQKDTDYYVHTSVFVKSGVSAKVFARAVRQKLGGKLKTFISLDDLADQMSGKSADAREKMARRACVDLSSMPVTERELHNFFARHPHIRHARFLNSEIPELPSMELDDIHVFLHRMLNRMAIVRGLDKKDVEEQTNRYMLARYYLHPYLPIGFNVDDYLARIVYAPIDEDPANFVRNLVYIIKAYLSYRPIETYNPDELNRLTEAIWTSV